MLDFYTWNTPNGHKIYIMLEELGATYDVHPVDISASAQFSQDYISINPNSKIPAIVDRETGQTTFESGAILLELADRYGRFAPQEHRSGVRSWLMFQMASVGPIFGQHFHFHKVATRHVSSPAELKYARKRFHGELVRLLEVMEHALQDQEYFATRYSIADMALYPWVRGFEQRGVSAEEFPNLTAWCARVGERPAVKRALELAQSHAA